MLILPETNEDYFLKAQFLRGVHIFHNFVSVVFESFLDCARDVFLLFTFLDIPAIFIINFG